MAKFDGIPTFVGSEGPVCIYQMYGRYFMRTRSSLTGERVKKDPAFRKTMAYAGLLAQASKIGSTVYALVPAERRKHTLYRKLTGEAMTWLKYQWAAQDIVEYLTRQYAGNTPPPPEGRVTVLRARYRPPRPGLRRTLLEIAKAPKTRRIPRALQKWRERDKELRRSARESAWSGGS
ncbi:hypothetical protein [Paraflavitalea pollutisoli]|uniref:hypothetical protein n=1 Tax=Paraflavitalea pollutisoli TaxID=3034143 RepID=UPI0023EB2D87|nr:hypothetical protein [Paraflavitalea sp. H1-2-19X]